MRSGLAHELAVFDDVGEALVVLVNVEGTVMLMDLAREKILGVSGDDMVGVFRELLVAEGMQRASGPTVGVRRRAFRRPCPSAKRGTGTPDESVAKNEAVEPPARPARAGS